MLEPQLHCPNGVTYDDVAHTYLLDGRPVPPVSTMLKVINPDQYSGVAAEVMERAATRGKNCHAMVALAARDDLDMASLSDALVDQWIAWDAFCNDFQAEIIYSERVVCSRKYQFCGTLDLGLKIKHKKRPGNWLVDLKNVAAKPVMVGIQTAGYNIAASECLPDWSEDTPRACLWIQGDRYHFIECNDASDRADFLAARRIINYREKNK